MVCITLYAKEAWPGDVESKICPMNLDDPCEQHLSPYTYPSTALAWFTAVNCMALITLGMILDWVEKLTAITDEINSKASWNGFNASLNSCNSYRCRCLYYLSVMFYNQIL